MIDWKRVTALRHEVGETEFRPLVEMFLDEIGHAIMALVPGDTDSLIRTLEFMRGCALNIGFDAFRRTCETWEATITQGRATELQDHLLMAIYVASRQVLLRDLDRMTRAGSAHPGAA